MLYISRLLVQFFNRETILRANQCRMKRRELYLTAITIRGPYVRRRRSFRICSQRRNIHIARE